MNPRPSVEIPVATPIRILHVLRSIDPVDGDLPRMAVRMAVEQVSAGCHVTVVTMDTADVMVHAQAEYGGLPGYNRLHIIHSHDRASLAYVFGSNAMQWLRPMVPMVRILHVHGMWEALLHRAARLGRRNGVPVVVTPHSNRPPPAPAWLGGPLRAALRVGWSDMLRQAALVHVLDGDDARHLEHLGVRANVRCIPDGESMARRILEEYPVGGESKGSPAADLRLK